MAGLSLTWIPLKRRSHTIFGKMWRMVKDGSTCSSLCQQPPRETPHPTCSTGRRNWTTKRMTGLLNMYAVQSIIIGVNVVIHNINNSIFFLFLQQAKNSFKKIKDVGHLLVKVFKATGLASADIGGKSDPFCVVELNNDRFSTHTEYKTLTPSWDKIYQL